MKNVIVIGGAGYVGCKLIPALLEENYKVTVFDLMIYGNNLPADSKNLNIIKGDVRDLEKLKQVLKDQETVIHLACISNDPSFELNPKLGKEINFDCFKPLVMASKESGIKHFIYASSSSVYGVKDISDVTEDARLDPLTDYSKFKAQCEDILLSNTNKNFIGTILRPATVCGYSPRQRLDLVVNILTNQGYHKKKIKIFGGAQLRPNIHISDMVDSYICLLKADKNKLHDQIFNVGFENYSVEILANMVKKNINNNVELEFSKSDDNRSYHINSDKITKIINFFPKKNIDEGIKELIKAFEQKLLLNTFDNEEYFNIKKMQKINLV
ncbi:MAG: SDR family oxidoreductase [Proteobacteria bacterium]|nr:SDR family oxidoreductase [Pseudomonadota bacterium]